MAAVTTMAQEEETMMAMQGQDADVISADSLIASSPSPEAPRKQRRTSRSPSLGKFLPTPGSKASASTSLRGSTRAAPPGTPVIKIGKARASSAPRGAGRPPSPALERIRVGDHRFEGGAGSIEQRLAAVEAQQAADHAYFAELTTAVRGLVATGEHLRNDQATLRNEAPDRASFGFQVQKELAVLRTTFDDDLLKTAAILEGRVQEMQNAITTLQVAMANMGDREGQMAEYLSLSPWHAPSGRTGAPQLFPAGQRRNHLRQRARSPVRAQELPAAQHPQHCGRHAPGDRQDAGPTLHDVGYLQQRVRGDLRRLDDHAAAHRGPRDEAADVRRGVLRTVELLGGTGPQARSLLGLPGRNRHCHSQWRRRRRRADAL